ncbi:MAG: hypothetical protein WCG06_04255, partial [Candidatus Omnitrophota bacterium]
MSKINEALRQAEKLGQVDRALQSGHLKNILNILDEPKQDISSQEPAKTRPSVVGPQEAVKQMEELSHHVEKSLDDLKGQVDADAAAEHISREAKDVFERGLALARQGMYREAIDWWKRLTLLSGLGEPLSASIRNFERIFNEMEHAQRLLGQRQARPDAVPTILEGAEDLVETICRRLEAETEALKDRRIDAQAQSAERAQNIESGLQKARFFIEHKQTASAIEQLVKTAASLD